MTLKVGDRAPDFELPATGGRVFRLGSSLSDGKLVLYFYPKDFTAGCTAEACGFRDEFSELRKSEVKVFGISTDTLISHERFKKEHQLPFDLLSDPNGEVARLYGVYNRLFRIANRVTFIVDSDGTISSITKNMFVPKAHVRAARSIG
ncbi:MAG: peroxiredoxin [Candidatus Kryptoniota bacterium]